MAAWLVVQTVALKVVHWDDMMVDAMDGRSDVD